MEILTDIVLKAHWFKTHDHVYVTDKHTLLTPAAKDFIKEHHIQLVYADSGGCEKAAACRERDKSVICRENNKPSGDGAAMPMTPIQKDDSGRPVYIDEATGRTMTEKPEHMTHLYGNHLVPKTNLRIVFRGRLDSLEAQLMQVQLLARRKNEETLVRDLSEMLSFVRMLVSSEVRNKPVCQMTLLNTDSDGLRYMSHHVREIFGIAHPTPEYTMGEICVALNRLRTAVRETELAAAAAFCSADGCERADIVEALNRLSSAVYILFLRALTKTNRDSGCDVYVKTKNSENEKKAVFVEASGRHVHLTKKALLALFGREELTKKSDLSQPGQYAAKERVTLMTSKGELERVAVLGPVRDEVQVEISLTDAKILGLDVPVNLSGDLTGAADVIIVGPEGIYNAVGSVIAAKAHIHMTPEDAKKFHVEDKDVVSVRLDSERPVTLEDVVIRVSDKFSLAMHLDYDEANAARFKKGDMGYIIGRESAL